MGSRFAIREELLPDGTEVFAVAGEADMLHAAGFESRLISAIEAGHLAIVIDLSETTFIDSSMLRAFVGAWRRLSNRGGRMALVCSTPSICRFFELAGLDRIFELHPTREAALEMVRRGGGEPAPA